MDGNLDNATYGLTLAQNISASQNGVRLVTSNCEAKNKALLLRG